MTAQKCVVEGCDLEYDVVCSFSFYNANIGTDNEGKRQDWIDGAMREESELLWRHVSLQLCGYHFELDNQGLWIDSPMLPELLTPQEKSLQPTKEDKHRGATGGFQGLFEKFIGEKPKVTEMIKLDHNYSLPPVKDEAPENISRLNVRQLVDTLGYLSLKNLQRKQLWVVKVETDKAEASITQSEQVITKMSDSRQIIEILPQTSQATSTASNSGVLSMIDDSTIPDNFIYEIAEEQEITMDEVKEIPAEENQEWIVNILPEDTKPKYAYIKHCSTGKKKQHFTSDMNLSSDITLQGDFENYYILPDLDPSVGVEVTTSYESENYIVDGYEHLVLTEHTKKRTKPDSEKKKRKKVTVKHEKQAQHIQLTNDEGEDWGMDNSVVFDDSDDYDDKKAAARISVGDGDVSPSGFPSVGAPRPRPPRTPLEKYHQM